MGQFNLDRIYKPRSIAVVGASQRQGSIGNAVMANLIDGRFAGKLFPVNSKYRIINGLPCVKSISSLRAEVDLAVIATPIHTVPDVITDCVKQQVGGAIVISAGGRESGEKGRLIEQQIRQRRHGRKAGRAGRFERLGRARSVR